MTTTPTNLAAEVAGRQAIDTLCRKHTAFPEFALLLEAKGGYRPSIQKMSGKKGAELDILATAYDTAQMMRGDTRRAYRS